MLSILRPKVIVIIEDYRQIVGSPVLFLLILSNNVGIISTNRLSIVLIISLNFKRALLKYLKCYKKKYNCTLLKISIEYSLELMHFFH